VTDVSTSSPGVKRFIGIDWDFGALRQQSRTYWTFVALLGVFIIVGGAAWIVFIQKGGVVMAQRDGSPWGLWFTNYMYYVGLAAGGLIVYASVHLFGATQFAPLSRIAVLLAGVIVMLALLGVMTDFEKPARLINMLLSPNPTAPFVYTGSAAGLYMVLCFADLWVLITGKGGHKLAHTMTLIALPAAIYMHTTTAFVLSLNKSRELWHTAMMVPIFLTSATASGVALLLIVAYIMQKVTDLRFKPSMFRSLATLLATVIIIDQFLLGVEVLSVFWPTSAQPGHTIRFGQFLTGRLAWAFLPVFFLGMTSFALLAKRTTRHKPAIQITASALYVVAVFFKRYSLMAMGFSVNTLGQTQPVYFPSTVEIFLALGILALGMLLFTFLAKVLPMESEYHEHEAEFAAELDAAQEIASAAKGSPAAIAAGDPPNARGPGDSRGPGDARGPGDGALEPGVAS
jgi:molybdopterin-containing oxidoreductase family membrane subunit